LQSGGASRLSSGQNTLDIRERDGAGANELGFRAGEIDYG
jgi:hypothetical protein